MARLVCCCCHTDREHIPQQGSANKQMVCVVCQHNYVWKIIWDKLLSFKNSVSIAPENCSQTVGRHLLTRHTFCSSGSSWTDHNKRILAPVDENKTNLPSHGLPGGIGTFIGLLVIWMFNWKSSVKTLKSEEIENSTLQLQFLSSGLEHLKHGEDCVDPV